MDTGRELNKFERLIEAQRMNHSISDVVTFKIL